MEKKNIKYPNVKTYFVAFTDKKLFSYGIVDKDQFMETPHTNLWTTTNEKDWKKYLSDFNVTDFTDYVGT